MCLMACDKVWGGAAELFGYVGERGGAGFDFRVGQGSFFEFESRGAANVFASAPCGFHCNWAPGCPGLSMTGVVPCWTKIK
jgi:hypothetical protein